MAPRAAHRRRRTSEEGIHCCLHFSNPGEGGLGPGWGWTDGASPVDGVQLCADVTWGPCAHSAPSHKITDSSDATPVTIISHEYSFFPFQLGSRAAACRSPATHRRVYCSPALSLVPTDPVGTRRRSGSQGSVGGNISEYQGTFR